MFSFDEAGDDELVHKVDDGGQNALDSPDQHFIIEQINIKAVGESPGNLQSGNMAAYTALFGIGLLLVIYFTVFYSC